MMETTVVLPGSQDNILFDKEETSALSYSWNQTEDEIDIKLKGSDENLRKFDATFSSKSANISLSEKENHSLHFYDMIAKEKSRVEIKKGNVSIHVVKKSPGLWPSLESVKSPASSLGPDSLQAEQTEEKDEKPVYHLGHLKHDFFERGLLLTLQVFVRGCQKEDIKLDFSKQGFVLNFHTSDERFLKLHKDTTRDTLFSWAVTTRGEIQAESCHHKVKPAVIEVVLHKVLPHRWPSLEAPTHSAGGQSLSANSHDWMPMKTLPGKAMPVSALSASSSSSDITASSLARPAGKAKAGPSSLSLSGADNNDDDDMEDVDLRVKKTRVARLAHNDIGSSGSSHQSISGLCENLKLRTGHESMKPTAKVLPLAKPREETSLVVSPGFAGLVNLGNTCFMNCVLQVLANTGEFRDYFLDGRFQQEINEDNPLGMKGHLAVTFGLLLRNLWSCRRHCWEPHKLKDLISKKNPQFFGFAQHDAHEFLAFLLDGLHEDLNRIRHKPYTTTVDSDGRPDDEVAQEAWHQFKRRNDSVVVDLFQGQYKSKLICPQCGKVSITFDPFLYLTVPLPKKKKVITVTFMWKEFYKKPHGYQVSVSQDGCVEELLTSLAQRTLVKTQHIRVFEAYRGKIHKFFPPGSSMGQVDAKDTIIACEVLSEEMAGEEVVEIPVIQRSLSPTELPSRCGFCHKPCGEGQALKRCTKCYKVGYCDRTCQREHWSSHKPQCSHSPESIGCPFILSAPASRLTYSHLAKAMEGFARFSVNLFQPPVRPSEGVANPSSCHLSSPSNLSSSLSQSCSSLSSLDSLSSASSTCTLTGDQSDPLAMDDPVDPPPASSSSSNDCDGSSVTGCSSASSLVTDSAHPEETKPGITTSTITTNNAPTSTTSVDSGIDSLASGKGEKSGVPPTSQVLGVAERDGVAATFFIKPVTMEGVGIKGADRLQDRGEEPLRLSSHTFLALDWRNTSRLPACVLVQAKTLEAKVDEDDRATLASSKPSLQQCLNLFTEPETLRPEEAWYCPSCRQHVEASKQMAIWRLPHTVIIQLKRFSFHNFLTRSKIKSHIHFPTRGLDLSEFCASKPQPLPGEEGKQPALYDLCGVVNHHGLLIGGHYTAYVSCHADQQQQQQPLGWRLCDDSRVSAVNEASAVTPDAYLLFYRRRGLTAAIGKSSPPPSPTLCPPVPHPISAMTGVTSTREDDKTKASQPQTMEEVDFNEAVSTTRWPHHQVGVKGQEDNRSGRQHQECEDSNRDGYSSSDDDNDDYEGYRKRRPLIVDTSVALGYTDMEAVD